MGASILLDISSYPANDRIGFLRFCRASFRDLLCQFFQYIFIRLIHMSNIKSAVCILINCVQIFYHCLSLSICNGAGFVLLRTVLACSLFSS